MRLITARYCAALAGVLLGLAAPAGATDWPTFRHDNRRSGVCAERLPLAELKLDWVHRSAHPPSPAWAGPARWDAYAGIRGLRSMRDYDPVYHVVIAAGRVYYGSSSDDSVSCLDAASGALLWRFTTGGPVRIAPTWDAGRLYFGSDDGRAYCLRAGDGALLWSFAPAPDQRRVVSNGKMISKWPVRSGVLIDGGTAYFAASMLPWKSSYLCALDAASGALAGPGRYVRELAPPRSFEGALLASAEELIAPQGRISPRLYRRADGHELGALEGGGGCFALLTEDHEILHGPGNKTGWITESSESTRAKLASFPGGNAMVVDGERAFLVSDHALAAIDRKRRAKLWSVPSEHPYEIIMAGGVLFAGGRDEVAAFEASSGRELWKAPLAGRAYGLAVAAGALYASTDQGYIYRFAAGGRCADPQVVRFPLGGAEPAADQLAPIDPLPPSAKLIGRWVFQRAELTTRAGAGARSADVSRGLVRDRAGDLPGTILGQARIERRGPLEFLRLDGQSASVLLSADLQAADLPAKQLGVEAWVRIDTPLRWGGIAGAFQDNGEDEKGWVLGYQEKRFFLGLRARQGTGRMTFVLSKKEYTLGTWHCVAASYDGARMRLFVDGVKAGESRAQRGAIFYPDQAFYELGAYHDRDEYFRLDGALHEVRVFRRSLSATQVRRDHDAKKGLFPAPLEFELSPVLRFVAAGRARIRWRTRQPSATILRIRCAGDQHIFEEAPARREHEVVAAVPISPQMLHYSIEAVVGGQRLASAEYECDTFFNFIRPRLSGRGAQADRAEGLLARSGVRRGIALVLGLEDGRLALELARHSDLRVLAVDPDPEKVVAARAMLHEAGAYGPYVTVQRVESLSALPFVPCFANLLVSEHAWPGPLDPAVEAEVQRVLRPGGGIALLGDPAQTEGRSITRIERAPLEGIGAWTHQYGRPDNSAFGGETLAGATSTADLALQWIGRPGPRAQADRNGRKPAPLAIAGRLFVQGLHRVIALDAYNGTILWSLEIPALARFNMPRDCGNWCADGEFLYLAVGSRCWKVTAAGGEIVARFELPRGSPGELEWGYLARCAGLVLGSVVPRGTGWTNFWGRASAGWYDAQSGPVTDKICSARLFALDARDGTIRWSRKRGKVLHPTITVLDDRIFFVECRHPKVMTAAAGRIGLAELWEDLFLVALDVRTGKRLWQRPLDVAPGTVVFYMAAGEDHLAIVSSSAGHYDVYVHTAGEGRRLWHERFGWPGGKGDHGKHMSRPLIAGGRLYVRPRVFDLHSGARYQRDQPDGGCGTYAAASAAIIYRAGAITLWDPESGKCSSWARLRPDCWLSAIPACGMLLAPEAGGGCSCGSWLETSVGFLPAGAR